MKIEMLVTNVTSVGSPAKAEQRAILGVILDVSWLIQATLGAGGPLCEIGIPS